MVARQLSRYGSIQENCMDLLLLCTDQWEAYSQRRVNLQRQSNSAACLTTKYVGEEKLARKPELEPCWSDNDEQLAVSMNDMC